jgi:hypothetical protein
MYLYWRSRSTWVRALLSSLAVPSISLPACTYLYSGKTRCAASPWDGTEGHGQGSRHQRANAVGPRMPGQIINVIGEPVGERGPSSPAGMRPCSSSMPLDQNLRIHPPLSISTTPELRRPVKVGSSQRMREAEKV